MHIALVLSQPAVSDHDRAAVSREAREWSERCDAAGVTGFSIRIGPVLLSMMEGEQQKLGDVLESRNEEAPVVLSVQPVDSRRFSGWRTTVVNVNDPKSIAGRVEKLRQRIAAEPRTSYAHAVEALVAP